MVRKHTVQPRPESCEESQATPLSQSMDEESGTLQNSAGEEQRSECADQGREFRFARNEAEEHEKSRDSSAIEILFLLSLSSSMSCIKTISLSNVMKFCCLSYRLEFYRTPLTGGSLFADFDGLKRGMRTSFLTLDT
ncbi:hypothetical protein NC653_031282 [Populus alba x Populus x berolinensis]|uniref:Uncharacterized protein n=1 Tax=Populus alba x Populus x berolinensis TaxID=444605 RepID=A0AAD6Q169_9ROSI|nr:hypothetical protein NC653_031282 [Populus alba x Populus x berolinensis]